MTDNTNNNIINGVDIAEWHRKSGRVTEWLTISGDLPFDLGLALAQLEEWEKAHITHIIDVRGEWSDEELVRTHAPGIGYTYLGTHDNGGAQSDAWFHAGIEAAHKARAFREDPMLMVHCHMGINRGPSMAYAMLLDAGYDVVEALDMIRKARPIAGIIYAIDAVRAVGRLHDRSQADIEKDMDRVDAWFRTNRIDIKNIIRRIREQGE